jgi:dynein heavy chain
MGNVTVQTIENVATGSFIKDFINVKHPSLMIGHAGCGKTQLAKGILRQILQEKGDQFAFI